MQEKSYKKLDFDTAMELARTDPEAFEQHRQEAIEAFIASAPERNRHQLRCLQWRIDQERERASNPISACVRLYRMMWDSFAGQCGLVDTMRNAHKSPGNLESLLPRAEVLSFPKKATGKCHSK